MRKERKRAKKERQREREKEKMKEGGNEEVKGSGDVGGCGKVKMKKRRKKLDSRRGVS